MATSRIVSNKVVLTSPFLVRKFVCTGGTTASAATEHGEDRPPDMILSQVLTESATVTTVIVTRESDTTFKLDTLGDAANDIEVYMIWFSQAKGGISA